MVFDGGLWTPFMKEDENGKMVRVAAKSIKTRKNFKKLNLNSDSQINYAVKYINEYKDAIKKRNYKIGVSCVYGCILQTLYEFMVGVTDFMMMLYDDKQLIEDMLEVSTEHYLKMTKELVKTGVDFIYIADDIAFNKNLFINPKAMKEIWVPRLARIIEPAVDAGIPVMFHSDGKIDEIVEELINMGVKCLNPMDPTGVDYSEYKKKYGDRLCLSGNVDIDNILSKGTPEDIEADVRKHMEILKPGYGYIASSSHSIMNYIPHENVIAYINAMHKYGKY